MAASATPTNRSSHGGMNEGSRQEIKAAIAKAAELRAIHAALMQGTTSPTHLSLFSSSGSGGHHRRPPLPPPPPPPQLSAAHDYPVFTPSYEDETLPAGYRHLQQESQVLSESWGDHHRYGLKQDNGTSIIQSDYQRETTMSPLAKGRLNSHCHNYYGDDNQETRSVTSSCTNPISTLQTSPAVEVLNSRRRNSLGDFKSASSKLGFSDVDSIAHSSCLNSNIVVPLTDSHVAVHPQHKSKKMIFSRIFSRLKKKAKGENSEGFSQVLRDFGAVSVDTLKKELVEVNRERDAALLEVAEMKSSFGDLRKKLDNLEGYCEELKRALRQAPNANNSQSYQKQSLSKSGKLVDGNGGDTNVMPVCKEVMTEGFLQVVSEARLSVKHFCKSLIGQIDGTDDQLINNLDALLQPYKLSLISSKNSKAVLYHLEALVNETLYQDFENCAFQRNGSPKLLDPQQDRQAKFSSFVALRNLSWNEVLRKGTKYYSEDFSKFCDQKMSSIISTLNWIRPWPEQLLESFFVAAKCVWLLHLLAFSCYPALTIARVEESRPFDPHYMEDILMDKQRAQQGTSRVKIMVMPGFYVQDKILRCKVLCRYKPFK